MAAVPRPPLRVWIWTAATLALVVVATVLWRNSDAAATTHSTAGPSQVPSGEPAATLTQRWSAEGDPLPDPVVARGRVILGSAHGMRALDPVTGREAWHYARSNARLCGLAAIDTVVVAVFRTADRCDEAVALAADTGVYAWTRNVNLRADATLSGAPQIVVATSPTGLLTLDPVGDNVRWRYRPEAGCRILDARPGSDGVAVLERCGAGSQVRLLDLFSGNPRWTRQLSAPSAAAPSLLGADRAVGVALGDSLQLLATSDGAPMAVVPAGGGGAAAEQVIGDVALLWRGGTLTAVDVATGSQLWRQPSHGLPTLPASSTAVESVDAVLVPEDGGFVRRDLHSGDELGRSAVAGLPSGGVATQVGPVVVYRLPDRVLAYG